MRRKRSGKRANGEGTCKQLTNGRWKATYTVGRTAEGKLVRRSVNGASREEALRLMRERQHRLAHGQPVVTGQETVEHYLARWLVGVASKRVKPSTLERYRSALKPLYPLIGHLRLADLRVGHLQEAFGNLEVRYSPGDLHNKQAVLHNALENAVKWELIDRNPAGFITLPKVEKKTWTVLTPDQARHLIASQPESRWNPLWTLLTTLGPRISEALALRWDEYGHGVLQIREGKTEAAQRTLPVPPTVAAALKAQRVQQLTDRMRNADIWQDSGVIFTDALGRSMSRQNAYEAWVRALEHAGLPHMRLHDTRRTAILWMREAGIELDVVRVIIGHKHIATTTEIYGTVNRARLDAARDRMAAFLKEG